MKSMTEEQLDRAIRVLGPKVVSSVMRMSQKQLEDFEKRVDELVESKRYKTAEWYKPGKWIEIT